MQINIFRRPAAALNFVALDVAPRRQFAERPLERILVKALPLAQRVRQCPFKDAGLAALLQQRQDLLCLPADRVLLAIEAEHMLNEPAHQRHRVAHPRRADGLLVRPRAQDRRQPRRTARQLAAHAQPLQR